MQGIYPGWPAHSGQFLPASAQAPSWAPTPHRSFYDLPHVMSELPTYLRNWVHAISTQLGVDRGMALSTLLSGMGSAVQGVRVAHLPDGGEEPLCLFSFVLAGPTTGKTRTHRLVHQAHDAHDVARYQTYTDRKVGAGADRARSANDDEAHRSRPTPPRPRSVLLQDVSNRGLVEALQGIGESTAISADEGQQVLGTALFRRHFATLNGLHDGKGRSMIRRGKGDVVAAYDAFLTVLVMVQPEIFDQYLETHGETARGIGFLARCLFTLPPTFHEHGQAFPQPPDGCLGRYHEQVAAFLNQRLVQLEAGSAKPLPLYFSPDAAQLWRELLAEQRQMALSRYWHVQDAANRAMQNVARIAGIIQCYSEDGDEISVGALKAAWAIAQWHLGQFERLFPPKALPAVPMPKPTTQEKQQRREFDDCQKILDCIADACARNREADALKSKVFIRSGLYNARFRTALMRLVDEGMVVESGEGQQTRLSIVPIHPIPLMNSEPLVYLGKAPL